MKLVLRLRLWAQKVPYLLPDETSGWTWSYVLGRVNDILDPVIYGNDQKAFRLAQEVYQEIMSTVTHFMDTFSSVHKMIGP